MSERCMRNGTFSNRPPKARDARSQGLSCLAPRVRRRWPPSDALENGTACISESLEPMSRASIFSFALWWARNYALSAVLEGLVPTAVAPAGCKSKCHCEHRYIIGPHCNSSEAVYEDMRHICLSSSRKAGLTTMPPRPCNQLPTSQPTANQATAGPADQSADQPAQPSHSATKPTSHPASQPFFLPIKTNKESYC